MTLVVRLKSSRIWDRLTIQPGPDDREEKEIITYLSPTVPISLHPVGLSSFFPRDLGGWDIRRDLPEGSLRLRRESRFKKNDSNR